MDWPEIKRRLTKEGTSVQILADLEGVPYKTMYQRIKWHERQDGKKYMPEMKTKKKEKLPEVTEEIMDMGNQRARIVDGRKIPDVSTAFDEIPISELITCKYCKNVSHMDNEAFCTMGHVYDGVNGTCSDWRAEGKLAPVDIPEEIKNTDVATIKGIRVEGARDIPEDVYTNERKLMPETIEEILTMYKQCCELAERYTKQAEDWARFMDVLQLEERERIRRK